MTHQQDCPALDPFAHLLGDYGKCSCGAGNTWFPGDPAVLIAEAAKDERSRAGYKYNPEAMALRVRQGLRVGDRCGLGAAVAEYLGNLKIEISATGKPALIKEITDGDAAIMLIMLAKGAAHISDTITW